MDEQQRATLLDELARDAARRREEFLDDAGRQFMRFLDANKSRLRDLGGLVLIDDEPDYLSISEEGTFSSRTRYRDDDGQWVSETEEIKDGADLVEMYNPADLYAAFTDAAKDEVELVAGQADGAEPTAEVETDAESDDEAAPSEEVLADSDWLAPVATPRDKSDAARVMYDLALTFQERSQVREAQLLDDFQFVSENAAAVLGDSKVADDEDERLWFRASGAFEGEVVPEEDENGEPVWQSLTTPDEMVQFYDPTDLFGDLADALAEAYPHVAPELEGDELADAAAAADGERDES
jgi:hypothetical protein